MTYINGFIVGTRDQCGIKTYLVPGTNTYLPVRSDVAPLLIGFAKEFNDTVEELHDGWSWGYAYRSVRGYFTPSFHAAGIAIDLNAPAHVMGRSGTFSPRQTATIRALAKKYGLRWGGDYTKRKDEMHFEVILSKDDALALVKRLQTPVKKASTSGVVVPRLANLKYRTRNNAVINLQKRLALLGFYKLKTYGNFYGTNTFNSVKAFQKSVGLTVDGIVGPKTYEKLFNRKPL